MELVAVLPAIAIAVLIAGQAVSAGWALWSAGNAARAGARAAEVGSDGEGAATRALPRPLRGEAEVEAGDGVRVSVPIPAILPGIELPRISASARLVADTGGG